MAKKQANAGAAFIDVYASVLEAEELETLKQLFGVDGCITGADGYAAIIS
ncbi:hypothetical protein FACS1894200_13830 [Spirochaetia bacterium]|nr:hypothetical protein FACS1894200_13830 [Spirochaetia bacterium]